MLDAFDQYQKNLNNIDVVHENIKNNVRSSIYSLLSDFNMVNYLLGDNFPYLVPADLQNLMSRLITVGQPSYINNTVNGVTPVQIIIANVETERISSWRTAIAPHFYMLPMLLPVSDPTTILLLTIHPLVEN